MLRNQNLKRWKSGDSRTINVTVTDGVGDPQDLTGASFTFSLAQRTGQTYAASALIIKNSGAGITITDAPNGQIAIAIDPDDTASLGGQYYYEVQMTDASGNIGTVTTGFVTIEKDLIE